MTNMTDVDPLVERTNLETKTDREDQVVTILPREDKYSKINSFNIHVYIHILAQYLGILIILSKTMMKTFYADQNDGRDLPHCPNGLHGLLDDSMKRLNKIRLENVLERSQTEPTLGKTAIYNPFNPQTADLAVCWHLGNDYMPDPDLRIQ